MDTIDALRERSNALDKQIERMSLAQEIRTKESVIGVSTMQEAYPEILTSADIRRETGWTESHLGYGTASLPDDYKDGHYRPFWQSEGEHQQVRGLGRTLSGSTELASCILSNLRNYTVGQGSTVTVTAKDGDEGLEREAQAFLDDFIDFNEITDELESDLLLDGVVDGDSLLALEGANGGGIPRLDLIGGEHVMAPDNPRAIEDFLGETSLSWTYGVASELNRPSNVRGYFVDMFREGGENWDFYDNSRAVLYKRNVPRSVKRGASDFFIPFKTMERGKKLFENAVLGAAIQASIAGIRKAAKGTSSGNLPGTTLADRLTSPGTARNPDGSSSSVTYERHRGGKIVNMANYDYMYGPMGTPQGATFLDSIYQAVARLVGTRWCMPEYMISGDASNNNYASSLVAESPFVKQVLREQATLARAFKKLYYRALAMGLSGVTRRDVTVEVEFPSPESRNALEQESVMDRQQAAGVLSRPTRAAKSNLDYDDEVKNGAKPDASLAASATQQAAVEASLESVNTTEEARALLRYL